MIDTIYGLVMGPQAEDNLDPATFCIVPFEVVEVSKNRTARPEGICFVTVVFRPTIPVPMLDLFPEQRLYWGRDAGCDATFVDMLPFRTAPYHGFREVGTERLTGHGEFFASLAEARSRKIFAPNSLIDLAG
jgi:hypothetical protein